MPFSTWWCHLEVGEIVLQHVQAPPDLFFIHWYLKEVSVNEEGFLTVEYAYTTVHGQVPDGAYTGQPAAEIRRTL